MFDKLCLVRINNQVYIAIPYPEDEELILVDVNKNLLFSNCVQKDSVDLIAI